MDRDSSKLVVGVDLGATNLRACLGTQDGRIIEKISEKTKRSGKSGFTVTKQLKSMISSIVSDFSHIAGIGIGSIGPLDIHRGIVKASPNVPYKRIPLKKPLETMANTPVSILNDCATAVVGEHHFGAGKNKSNLAFITISSGIGGGIIVDGRVLLGRKGNATEIGHVIVDAQGKLKCGCGKRGHWEAYCGGENIPNYARLLIDEGKISAKRLLKGKVRKEEITSEFIYDQAKEGNNEARKMVEKIGKINTIGFADVINCFAPSLITVSGAVALNNPKLVLGPVKERVKHLAINEVPPIKLSPLGRDIVLYGAIWLASHRLSSLQC